MAIVNLIQSPMIKGDSPAAARTRVMLKLAALGYHGIRCGADATPALVGASLVHLAGCAVGYYHALGGSLPRPESIAPTPEAEQCLAQLQISASAYSCARHGSDACIEFSRDALGALCMAAIAYCQSLPGADTDARIVDSGLALDRG